MGELMSTFEPEAFGKYVLVDHIATGGMAEIFKAKRYGHGGFESLLVIKRILPHIGKKPDFVEMFIDEAKISVALQHPNIVRVFDFGKLPGVDELGKPAENYFIAMECVDGKDVRYLLRQLARRQRYLPDRFAAFIAFEACKGLHYAHQKSDLHGQPYGVVHRDVSPSNILVSYEGEVKVADFGIAKAESNAYETKDGVLKGKFEYMSPEQASGAAVDGRSDVFSLGIVLYEMLTSRRLFKTGSDVDTLKMIRDQDVVAPSKLKPDVAPALEAVAMRALSRNVDERYPSAQAMAEELREYLFPASPDTLREELSDFLSELFDAEMTEERSRLQAGSERAFELNEQGVWDWDGNTSTMSHTAQTAVRLVVPTIAGGLIAIVLGMGLLGGAAFVFRNELVAMLGQETAVATRGTLELLVVPDAVLYIDGVRRGEGATITVPDLPPGTFLVRLDAEGYESLEKTVVIEVGKTVKLAEQLSARPAKAPKAPKAVEPAPSGDGGADADSPPRLVLISSPSGAVAYVDGKEVGSTPTTFTTRPGVAHQVEMRLDGHDAASQKVAGLDMGERRRVSLTLPEAAQSGTLTVTLVGGGWANVYVDGKKLGKTAPLRDVELSAGPHEIRVANEALGLDQTEQVTVAAGQAVTVRAVTD